MVLIQRIVATTIGTPSPRTADRRGGRKTLGGCLLLAALSVAPSSVDADTWTALSTGRSIEADLVGLFGDNAVMRLTDGRRISVNINQLQAESRLRAKELGQQQAETRAKRVATLQGLADVAAAPAPNPLPSPEPVSDYVAPREGMSAVETLEYLDQQARAGHALLAMYDTLPPSIRDQVDQLVAQVSLKIDPNGWAAATGSAHRIGDLVVTRQNWFFSYPHLQQLPQEQFEPLKSSMLSLAGMLRSGFAPEVASLESLRNDSLRDWIANFDAAVAPHLAELAKSSSQSFTMQRESKDSATVQVSDGTTSVPVELKLVDGVWTFAALADQWPQWFQDAQSRLDTTPDDSLGNQGPAMFASFMDSQLQPLMGAGGASDFHAALDELVKQAVVQVTLLAAQMPKELQGLGLGPRPGQNASGDDYYGDEYGDGYSGDGGDGSEEEMSDYGDSYRG